MVRELEVENNVSFKHICKETKKILSKKVVQWIIVSIIFLIILIVSSNVRLSNLDLLTDVTTGKQIPTDLDSYYFLRIAQTILDNGALPEYDSYRVAVYGGVEYLKEILPYAIIWIYKVVNFFGGDITLSYAAIISTVIFYVLGLITFFFLIYIITNNKWISLGSSAFLSVTVSYLYRTMAGVSDHDAMGIFAVFVAYLSFALLIKKLNSKSKNSQIILLSLLLGFTTAFTVASWAGSTTFLFIIFPLAILLHWVSSVKEDEGLAKKIILSYSIWLFSFLIFGILLNQSIHELVNRFLLSTNGIISVAVYLFLLVDFFIARYLKNLKFINKDYRTLYTILFAVILGFLGLFIIGKNPFNLIANIVDYLIHPFGTARISLTVAENSQPYLVDWVNNTGATIFYLFILGMFLFGIKIMNNLKLSKDKLIFIVSYIFMVAGILYSRISPTNILNGTNFISKIFYFIPLIWFWVYLFYLKIKKDFKWEDMDYFIFAWMFFTLISGRAATRVFFALTPFVCFFAVYGINELIKIFKKTKDDTMKVLLSILIVFVIIVSAIGIANSYETIKISAQYIGLSADTQWQKSMSWVRENTTTDSVFSHWWDYGYWVEYLGERATIADGGHFQGETVTHNIARYLLTTPWPKSANSFVKSMNISYLLIDPTDLGKYSAYSKIGSDDEWDRFSVIPVGQYDVKQTQETSNETMMVYYIQGMVDEDISYDNNETNTKIFLPGPSYDKIGNPTPNSYIIGVIFRTNNEDELLQPTGIYYYNQKQYNMPIRYVYINNMMYDFETGIDAVLSMIPAVTSSGSIERIGGMVYLSPKVKNSLFAQLYLLDDAFENYENFVLAHEELDPVMEQVRNVYTEFGDEEFILYGGNFRGPIKIFDVTNTTKDSKVYEDFFKSDTGKFAEMDFYFN